MRCVPIAVLVAACAEQPVAPDTAPPALAILWPAANAYDDDGDGLLDLRVAWADSGGRGVDLASLRVRVLSSGAPPGLDTNALAHWRVERLDDSGLVVHETAAALLPEGLAAIEVSVGDSAGNRTQDTVYAGTLNAVYVRHIAGDFPPRFIGAQHATICPDDGLLYLTVYEKIMVIDPDSLRLIATVPGMVFGDILWRPLCLANQPLYVTDIRVKQLDRRTRTWLDPLDSTFASIAVAQSRRDPDILYFGEEISGLIGEYRISTRHRRRLLTILQDAAILDIELLPQDTKLYATRSPGGGVLVVDVTLDSIVSTIKFAGAQPGTAQGLALSPDANRLYVAVTDGTPSGLAEVDTQTDSVTRFLRLDGRPIDVAVCPDGTRLFVTTGDVNGPSHNYLIDAATMTILRQLPRDRPPGAIRFDRGVIFHPRGHYIFVARDHGLDVYLHRQPAP